MTPAAKDFRRFFDYPTPPGASEEVFVFLAGLEQRDWERLLAHTETRLFRAGERVIRAGDHERALYLVLDGALEVLREEDGERTRLAEIRAPSVIGEMSFLEGTPRSRDLYALTDGQMLRLSFESFEALAARDPSVARAVLFDVARILARRLRQTGDRVSGQRP